MVLPYVFLCMGTPKGKRRDFEALEKRRFEAMRLLDEGLNQSETARRLTVARQTVSEWLRQYRAQGEAGLRKAGRAGRKPLLARISNLIQTSRPSGGLERLYS